MTPTPDQEKTAGRAGHGGAGECSNLPPQKPKVKYDLDAIRAAFDCRKYLESRGAKHLAGDRCTAPWRGNAIESNPALAVQPEKWHDHKLAKDAAL